MSNVNLGFDSNFYRALHFGRIFERMMDADEQASVYDFMCNSIIDRIKMERGFVYMGSSTPAYVWMYSFNNFGCSVPQIEKIWTEWWKFDHPGKAVSALMYASGLIYLEGENRIFGAYTQQKGGGGPYLTEIDSSFDNGWLDVNLNFLRNVLSVDYFYEKIFQAAEILNHEQEHKLAAQIVAEALQRKDIVIILIEDLIAGLSMYSHHQTRV
jgi:hypothetical protein